MSNNYVNHYIDILSGTLNDAILRNVSLQANAKVAEENSNNQSLQLEELTGIIDNLKNELETVKHSSNTDKDNHIKNLLAELKQKDEHLDGLIRQKDEHINNLNSQLSNYNTIKSEYENVRHQVNNIDTFRNELVKERTEHQKTRSEFESKINDIHQSYSKDIKELNDKIAYLQLTPAKRKKIDDANKVSLLETSESTVEPEITKDGGSF
jgi:chromosome segregation ATPase